ncbi:hypothetical protein BG015_011032 [Linnemannia schmuckeri]|uniref:Uncharacterized protein n=1 Tax=Linnemannia schmuckeri TaxID=64567 RepID=A0A9P5RVB4_9FUNG|nr:hypothetical protein BG015_011032 [Linnemannia schmuckeri]
MSLPTQTTKTIPISTFTSSSPPSIVSLPATSTSDNKNSPTPPAGKKIRITSSCNYTKPIIQLNFKSLHSKISAATTTSISPPTSPTQADPAKTQVSKIQAVLPSAPSPLPMSTPATPDTPSVFTPSTFAVPAPPPVVASTSTANLSISPKVTQKVASTIGANSANSNNGSSSSSNISLSPGYDCDLSGDVASMTDEADPDPDLHHRRRRQPQPQRTHSSSLPLPSPSSLPLHTKSQNQTQEPEMTSSTDGGEDPFKEFGLKSYSPIWLPSRTPSFELMRQRSYSPNPRHEMTIRSSNDCGDEHTDVLCPNDKNDRGISGFDLRKFLNEEADKSNNKDLINFPGKERQEIGSNHRYERFGSIKKRPSPLLPDHYDDLEDDDDDEVNQQMVHAKIDGMLTNKRPRRDHPQYHDQVPPTPPLSLPPNVNNNHGGTENDDGQGPSFHLWSDNSSGNHDHPHRHPPYGSQRFPPTQHHSHPRQQPYHHQYRPQQQDTLSNNNHPYNYHHHHHHQNNHPYQPQPWTSYRGIKYHYSGGFHTHTRQVFHPNHGDGEEESSWFHRDRASFGRGGRGRGHKRGGRGRGRSYSHAGYFGRYPFPPHHPGGGNGMDPYHRQQYQHHFEDECSMTDHRLEITNGSLTGTDTVNGPSSSPPPPPPSHFAVPPSSTAPSREHVVDSHPRPSSSSLSITSSPCTIAGTKHPSHSHNHHNHASAQQHHHDPIALNVHSTKAHMSVAPPQPFPSAMPSSTRTKTIVPLSNTTTSTTASLSYSFPSSLGTPSPPPQPIHHSLTSSRSFPRSRSRSMSKSPSPTSLEESAQKRLTRYASSETSSLAHKLATEQTLLLQAQKQIRFLTHTLKDLQDRHQLVEQNYDLLLAKYRREDGQ